MFSQAQASDFLDEAYLRMQAQRAGELAEQGISTGVTSGMIATTQKLLEEGKIDVEGYFRNLDTTVEAELETEAMDSAIDQWMAENGTLTFEGIVNMPDTGGSSSGGSSPPPQIPEGVQMGGPVFAGMPYYVGEAGRELFVPNQNGQIVPNRGLGGNITINNYTAAAAAVAMTMAWQQRRARY
jgi:hypothetical protein